MVDPSRGPDIEWCQKARFGMFINWVLYSLLGRGEWVMYQEHIPPEEYASLADRFNADAYDPSEWVALAMDAGMELNWLAVYGILMRSCHLLLGSPT